MGYFGSFIPTVALRIPMILVLIVGLVFSLQRLEKHPRISFLAGILFGGSLLLSILDALLKFLPVIAHDFFPYRSRR